ncbi:cation transport protein ChaC [Insolitispirillum peregrinum]|uniref:glutathione-specific gamma-glutamylcyclotransferase n=2 Tax=Insolitispirillum peregrinum TaxID=80876 RepID=A0A1N7Q516_9PROT|nr:cation transport protein ChaC [Insolitispirillum peregrinum]
MLSYDEALASWQDTPLGKTGTFLPLCSIMTVPLSFPEYWVFGYGSLMWNPGFEHQEAIAAEIDGYHRSFCIYSHHYRGTKSRPGLVLGLSPGGSCTGVAFRVAAARWPEVLEYLRERELLAYAYREAYLPVRLRDGRTRESFVVVADPAHRSYAGELPTPQAASIIMEACGHAGLNRDYLINTVRQLVQHGFRDAPLHELLKEVERQTGELDAGMGI